jgi:iduronate 2-sulfatase
MTLRLLLALSLLTTSAIAAPSPEQPNVLFIAIDDLRPELGCYGTEAIQTPHLDALAATSLVFDRAYCQQAVCNPSRASIMTGLRPDTTGVHDLVTEFRDTIPDAVTLPEHFKQHGYFAVGMGKIFHNPFPDPQSWSIPKQPKPKGARAYSPEVLAMMKQKRQEARAAGMTERQIGNRIRGPATDIEDVPDNKRPDGALTELAVKHLRALKSKDQPFFLAVGYFQPHLPWTAPKKYWDLYDPAKIPPAPNPFLPKDAPAVAFGDRSFGGMYELMDCIDLKGAPNPFEGSLTEAQSRRLKHGYYASVSFIDSQVGILLAELDRLGLADDTIVVLWSDHGWKLGEHNGWCKQTNYEIDARVPLMLRAPGQSKGHRTQALVALIDVYPTLCDLAGLPIPKQLEGKSMTPLLTNPDATIRTTALSQFPRRHGGKQFMGYTIRTATHRYVEWRARDTGKITAQELYDHRTDPHENTNLAPHPEQKSLLQSLHTQLTTTLTN